MRKVFNLLIVFSILLLIACKTSSCVTYGNINTDIIGKQAINTEKYVLNSEGFKKKCKEEKISSKLSKWNFVPLKSYETQKGIKQYYYIKEVDYDSIIANKMYKLDLKIQRQDTTFNLIIRKTTSFK